MLNVTFIFNSVISWWSVLLIGEIRENHHLPQVTDILYHTMLYRVHLTWTGFTRLVVMGTDCIGSCISNYHMTTTAPLGLVQSRHQYHLLASNLTCSGSVVTEKLLINHTLTKVTGTNHLIGRSMEGCELNVFSLPVQRHLSFLYHLMSVHCLTIFQCNFFHRNRSTK